MNDKQTVFDDFLTLIDQEYKEYFEERTDDIHSIRRCFFVRNHIILNYRTQSQLQKEILDKVFIKFKELYGKEALFVEIP